MSNILVLYISLMSAIFILILRLQNDLRLRFRRTRRR